MLTSSALRSKSTTSVTSSHNSSKQPNINDIMKQSKQSENRTKLMKLKMEREEAILKQHEQFRDKQQYYNHVQVEQNERSRSIQNTNQSYLSQVQNNRVINQIDQLKTIYKDNEEQKVFSKKIKCRQDNIAKKQTLRLKEAENLSIQDQKLSQKQQFYQQQHENKKNFQSKLIEEHNRKKQQEEIENQQKQQKIQQMVNVIQQQKKLEMQTNDQLNSMRRSLSSSKNV